MSSSRLPVAVVPHFVSASCKGEKCPICHRSGIISDASHKVGEEIPHDDPNQMRHNLTQYLCCNCYSMVMGRATGCTMT